MDYKKSWEVLKETIEDWLEEEQNDDVIEAFEDILDRMISLEEAEYRGMFSER